MIVDLDTKFNKEFKRLVAKFLNDMSWPELKELMEDDNGDLQGLALLCTHAVHDGLSKWLTTGKNRIFTDDVDALFEDEEKAKEIVQEEIISAYLIIEVRKTEKYEKDNATKARKRAEARALKMQEELASRDSADAPAAGAPEGPAAGAPEHKDQWKAPRKALRQGAPRALPEAGEKKRKRVVSDDEEAPSPANAAGALEPPEDPEADAKREAKRAKSIRDAASRKRRTELARRFNPVVREVANTVKLYTNVVDGVTTRDLYKQASDYVFGDDEVQTTFQGWLSGKFDKCTFADVTNEWLDAKFPLPKPALAAAGPPTSRDVAMAERPATPVTPGRATTRSSPVPLDTPDSPRTTVTTPVTPGRAVPWHSPESAPAPAADAAPDAAPDAAADAAPEQLLAELQGDSSAELFEILSGDAAPAALAAPAPPAPAPPAPVAPVAPAPAAGGVGFLAAPPPVIDYSSLDYRP